MLFQAHKGVSTEYPENTMPAFQAAVEQLYQYIELDVSVTADGQFVLLHDDELNRTCRNADGSELTVPVSIGEITYSEALAYDAGIGFHKKFAGTRIPLLTQVLELVKGTGVRLKLDNKYRFFNPEQLEAFFELLKPWQQTVAFTCWDLDMVRDAQAHCPDSQIHYDGKVTEEILAELAELVPPEQLVVWLPLPSRLTSWVKVEFASEDMARRIREMARLGIWILSNYDQLEEAERLGASIVETNGQLKPVRNAGIVPDMHNHSKISHDARSDLHVFCREQLAKGITIAAITDHCDVQHHETQDLCGNARKTQEYVAQVQKEFEGRIRLLNGIEFGEAIWCPEATRQVLKACDYDVVIGSVHAVRFGDFTIPFSVGDFTGFTQQQVEAYMDMYFDDMWELLQVTDFDILAHLTNPLKYIEGKFGFRVDLSKYAEKIRKILQYTIQHGIAFEINTSSLLTPLKKTMPDFDIMRLYYEMGGYLITIGSDSHTTEYVAYEFPMVLERLKEIGFRNLFYFEDRKTVQCTLV